jgi:hypothetical protein
MALVKPTTFTVQQPMTLNGVAVTKGQVLTAPQVRAILHLDALVDRGWIKATPDVHQRRSQNPRGPHSSQTMLKQR